MGCSQSSTIYSIPVTPFEDSKGETQVYRNPLALTKLTYSIPNQPELKTMQDVFINTARQHSNRPFIGTREILPDGKLGRFQFKTYAEVLEICNQVGSGILNLDLAPTINEYKDMSLNFVAVYAKNREEYLELDLACCLYGVTLIPIYDTLGPEAVQFTFTQTNLTTVFCANNLVDTLLKEIKAGRTSKIAHLISFEPLKNSQITLAEEIGLNLYTWDQIINSGKENPREYVKILPHSIYTFSYTSGTTGTPKGAMLSHANVIAAIAAVYEKIDVGTPNTDVHLSYLPMAHVLERMFLCFLVSTGASIGFYSGDVQKLKDDLQELKPTVFPSVPRLFNRFHDAMKDGLGKLTGYKKVLADKALATKLYNLRNYGQYTHSLYDALVFKKTKQAVGGRVRYMITGSAPISEQVIDFLKVACCCPIFEGYGQTESAAASFLTLAADGISGHVGGPVTSIEFKLVDVVEMNYTAKDKDDKGEPLPRGEICMRGPSVFEGYYKDPAKTAEALDSDGWLSTGDIGQINQNGSLKIIDRKKNIFKLAIGEYIAAEKIENIFTRSKYCAEPFVYGDSLQHYLIGIIVPHKPAIENLGKELGIEGSFEELCANKRIVDKVMEDINKVGKIEGKLLSFELIKKMKLEPVSFALQDLMTPSFKLKRHEAKKVYKEYIDLMYSQPIDERK